MSERIKRYIPSFKRRKLNNARESTFLGTSDGNLRPLSNDNDGRGNRQKLPDSDTRFAEFRQPSVRPDKVAGSQRHHLWHLTKRDEGEERPERDVDVNPVPEIIDDLLDGGSGEGSGVTVTVSIGVSLHVSTVSSLGSTFVTVSTSWFTFDSSGGISVPEPTPTIPLSSTSELSLSTPSTTEETSVAATPASLTSVSSVSSTNVPESASSSTENVFTPLPVTTVTSMYQTIAPNMTEYFLVGRTRTSTRDGTVIIYSERSTRRTSSSRTTSTSSSTRISTSLVSTTTTVYPADSGPSSPESPTTTTTTLEPDSSSSSSSSSNGTSGGSVTENLPPILGGIFGGLAGIGLVLWALLFFLRRRRRNSRGGFLGFSRGGHQRALSHDAASGAMAEVSQSRSSVVPGIFTGAIFGRSSASTPPPGERGFVKISGRKLPSMYGDDMVPTSMAVASARASASEPGSRNVSGGTHPTMAGSFYQDDDALMQSQMHPPFAPSPARTALKTGSPALTSRIAEHDPDPDFSIQSHPPPMIHDPGEGTSRFPTPPPGAVRRMHSSIGADGVGRSLASQDGSKTSRFTEDV
ncbi:hypothetical protein ABW19_dt0202277 [Dactylella cylindrospora]|nr:hypothetical protein ABW19_dt0202277 [Dactylella cylindrospora]